MSDENKEAPKMDPDHTGEQGTRIDYPRRTLSREEYATEFDAVRDRKVQENRDTDRTNDDNTVNTGRVAGIAGIVLGVLALFMWTIVLGPVAAVLGYYAYSQDSRTVGAWGLALGVIATLSYFVLIPFVR
ncbi:DUF5353 domain-containing protein [Paenibacillus caui]|uniref:DUF5353 domain-containing protein n=1 Tax=Paenibacillus caui TaxID=2873927 RepID=UPI001F2B7CBE|nr:DUF5353 domain-containing protein [Paenibacillus caui]